MWQPLSITEHYYSPLPPAELLMRIAGRTAPIISSANGWGITRHSLPFHEFEGIVTDNYFAINTLANEERRSYTYLFRVGTRQPPQLEGWVTVEPAGGTYLRIQYNASSVPWWSVVIMLLLLAWAKVPLATWPTFHQLKPFLEASAGLLITSCIVGPTSLWLVRYQVKTHLIELLQLTGALP